METTAVQGRSQYQYPSSDSSANVDKITYRTDSLTYDYKSKDGDTVHLEYKRAELAMSMNNTKATALKPYQMSPEQAEKFRKGLNDELLRYKELLIKSITDPDGILDTEQDDEVAALEAKMPEYWNADNTSQRIVDFAASFLSSFEGENSEFFKRIKAAIEEGFKQAKDMLGELPGAVGGLVQKTYDMTMDKLDAIERERASGQSQNAQANPESYSAVA